MIDEPAPAPASDVDAPDPLERFRSSVVRRSVWVGWVILVLVTARAVNAGFVTDLQFLMAGGAAVGVMAIATVTDWDGLFRRHEPIGAWLVWAWAVAMAVQFGAFSWFPGLRGAMAPLFAGIVLMTGLVLERVKQATVTLVVILILLVVSVEVAGDAVDLAIPILTVVVVAVGASYAGLEYGRVSAGTREVLAELTEQRQSFERLYAVSATLGRAESLSEVLPELVGTICRYLGANIGVVFLYRPQTHTLRVISPIWVNSHTVDVANLEVPASGAGVISQIFRSGRAIKADAIRSAPDAYSVLGELGIAQALVAPLRVEGLNVGVMAVGDPITGDFAEGQADELAALGAGAALVLTQLGRYEEAAEMSRHLQEVARMKTDFVSVVSHELRTPLTSIIGSLDTVSRPELPPDSDMARDLLDSARRQAARLQRLIEDLLTMSRLERDAVPVRIESLSVASIVKDTAHLVAGLPNLTTSISPDELMVAADHDHLGRILINLLDNASKYADGSPVEIEAQAIVAGTRVAISVVDHGPGIPTEDRETVFDRFTQLEHASTRTRGGSGLGLSIVRGLVEAMDGSIELSDTPGGGATFTIVLPGQPVGARA
jgi:signal transduction histidine kinase